MKKNSKIDLSSGIGFEEWRKVGPQIMAEIARRKRREDPTLGFFLHLKLHFWEEVHTDGYPASEEIYKFFEGKNPFQARTEASRFIESTIGKYSKNTAPSIENHRAKLLRGLEIEFIPVMPSVWNQKIKGEKGVEIFQKKLRNQLKEDEKTVQLMRGEGHI